MQKPHLRYFDRRPRQSTPATDETPRNEAAQPERRSARAVGPGSASPSTSSCRLRCLPFPLRCTSTRIPQSHIVQNLETPTLIRTASITCAVFLPSRNKLKDNSLPSQLLLNLHKTERSPWFLLRFRRQKLLL
jgi:hypothetical protein